MITSLVHHARRHVIGYVALTCSMLALAGASYAALKIPNGAVGERQLRNHAIDPIKFDPIYQSGFLRHWASVSGTGGLVTSSPGGQSAADGIGNTVLTWGDGFSDRCAALATVVGGRVVPSSSSGGSGTTPSPPPDSGTGGFADASVSTVSGGATLVAVATYDDAGKPANEPFSVAVVCPPGAGSGRSYPTTLP